MTEKHYNYYTGTGALGALGRRFESCRPDQYRTAFPGGPFKWKIIAWAKRGQKNFLA